MYYLPNTNPLLTHFDPLVSVTLEFIEFDPPMPWWMGEQRKALVVSVRREPGVEPGVHVVQDPGHGIVNTRDSNNFDPVFRSNINSLGTIRQRFAIPTSQSSSSATIVRVLREVPIVDLRTNPNGMFPWNFGNYIKRVLQRLVRDGHINVVSMQCVSADEIYDRYLSHYFKDKRDR